MRRQRGQIIPKGAGKWLVRASAGRNGLGKRLYPSKVVHGTRQEAQKALTALTAHHDQGLSVEPGRRRVSAWLESWLETSAKGRVSAKTFRDYSKLLRIFVFPVLGSKRLEALAPKDIRALYQAMANRGLGRTTQYTAAVLRQALQAAVDDRHLTWNPAANIRLPKLVEPERTVLTADQAKTFLQTATSDPLCALWEVLLATGLRPGEALALKWADVDLQRGWLHVQRALVENTDGSFYLGETKTKASRRTVTLPPRTVSALEGHRLSQLERVLAEGERYDRAEDLIFGNRQGKPLDLSKVRTGFKALLKRAGLPPIKLYSLRHTCATLLLEMGEDLKAVSERLGHTTIVMTANTYAQVTPRMQQRAAEKLEALFAGER
jgi:integrase